MNSLFALLGGFILVLCITTLLNRSYNFFDNVLGVITFGVQLILFFSYYHMTVFFYNSTYCRRIEHPLEHLLCNFPCPVPFGYSVPHFKSYWKYRATGNCRWQTIWYLLRSKFCCFYFLFSADAACIHFLLPKNPDSPYLYRNQRRAQYCIYRIFKFTDCIFMRDRHRIFLCITAYLPSLYRRRKNVGQTFSSLCSTKPCAFFGWNDCCLFSALLSDAEYRQTDGAAAQRNRPCPR